MYHNYYFIKNNNKVKEYSFLKLIRYFNILNLSLPHSFLGLTGFSIFVVIGFQVITGIFLAAGYIPEPMVVPVSRETEDIEGCFIDDIFWLHERSVDILMILIYGHILRKLYIGPTTLQTEHSWKTGAFIFLFLQVVIFFGIVLCSSQLSEITLRIAANIIASITRFWTELDWIIFTDRALNSDTLIRMTILHYLTGILLPFFGLIHGIEMHYDWKSEANYTGLKESVNWVDEGLINELIKFLVTIWIFIFLSSLLFKLQEPISYEIFTWFDLGNLDINYKGVAPHWYFRPYMGWLGTLPDHYGGLIILFFFHILFYYQPDLMGRGNKSNPFNSNFYKGQQDNSLTFKGLNQNISPQYNLIYNITFIFFTLSLWYVGSFLPYGLMFHAVGGNIGLFIADLYIFFYLLFPRLRGQYSYILMLEEILNIIKINNISDKIYTNDNNKNEQKPRRINIFFFNSIIKDLKSYYSTSFKPRLIVFLITALPHSNKFWYGGFKEDIIAHKKYLLKLHLASKTKKARYFIRLRYNIATYLLKKRIRLNIKNLKGWIERNIKALKEWIEHNIRASKEWIKHNLIKALKEWIELNIKKALKEWIERNVKTLKEWLELNMKALKEWLELNIMKTLIEWVKLNIKGLKENIKLAITQALKKKINFTIQAIKEKIKSFFKK